MSVIRSSRCQCTGQAGIRGGCAQPLELVTILVGVGSWVSRRLKGGRLPAVGHAPGGRCGRPRGICSLAVTESALWPSRKVSGPRLLRLAGSLPLPNIYCFRRAVCARAANIDHPILRASFSACGGYPVRLDGLGCSHPIPPPCPLPNGIDDPATGRWARAQLGRTTLATVVSAMERRLRVHLGQLDQPG